MNVPLGPRNDIKEMLRPPKKNKIRRYQKSPLFVNDMIDYLKKMTNKVKIVY